ncbi:hypothetical protein BUALT_Bualt12G0001900 [Buddleja alternifolia]|uniref:Omega-hydroxypalmitate O-feruloyl transferase n=1 Tax=Buddleja alternifolia TaxID=168488 RepID=A0AAV6WSD6_9LAMI|nr:hypothetical protein BUALT_Bualt12G0001900 [Buddleja alternifolia]
MAQTVTLMASPPQPVPETTITCQDQPEPKLDFKVKVHETTILPPIQQTEIRKCCFLSNLDQNFNFYVSNVHFFSGNPDFPIEEVVRRLKAAVQKVLVPYDFAAGRVRQNHQSSLLEIDCDGTGAGFVVASSEYSLDDIGDDLIYPHPGYKQLAPQKLDNLGLNDPPLNIFQVTSFKCGGFSLGVSTQHLLFDGIGAKMFYENIASQAFEDKPLAVVPCNDRYLLAARSPPRVEFPHPELRLPVAVLPLSESNNIHPVQEEEEELVSKLFKLSSNQINYLREKAKPPPSSTETSTKPPIKITSFNVVAALIWRCKALSTMDVENDNRVCTLLSAVDIRPRLNPPLPPSYCGNAVINAYASSKCIELEDKPFSEIVKIISDGVTRVRDEYIRSTIDWIEINKGVPNGDYFISSWWRLGLEQLVYPWGKPIYSLPVMSHVKYVCFLLPSHDHLNNNNGGVNVVVTLPVKEMDKFQSLFYDSFKN